MNFTDVFIRKPVLATVVSLAILILGLRAGVALTVRQFPKTENATITVSTTYYGAAPDVIAGFITQPLEAAVAQAQGIDYLTSSSSSGVSTITAVLRLNYDSNRALAEINTKVNAVLNQLPKESQQPVVAIADSGNTDSMYITFFSDKLSTFEIHDYLLRVVQPRLQAIPGLQHAAVYSSGELAMRVWLDPARLAAHGVSADEVYTAINDNNYIAAIGQSRSEMIEIDLTAGTDLHTLDEFRNLVVKKSGTSVVRLADVANVVLGSEAYDMMVKFNGKAAVFIGIAAAPNANLLDVVDAVRSQLPDIITQLPAGMHAKINYDATDYIRTSVHEVIVTLSESLVIVTVVIFLFLGSLRSVIIPMIAMPLSLIGALFLMLVLGYSINLLTLLALVLAIGLVVDDAIIVVENVDRHMKLGQTPLQASLLAARELASPIIAISVVLIAVYVPIGFQGGLTGKLFTEFAFTLAGAVGVSAVVALTLSPMMSARFLKAEHQSNRFISLIDRNFEWFTRLYLRVLSGMLAAWKPVVVFGFIIIGLIIFMVAAPQPLGVKSELAPQEDQGFEIAISNAPSNATVQQLSLYGSQLYDMYRQIPEADQMFQLEGALGPSTNLSGHILKLWDDRDRSAGQIQIDLQKRYSTIAGVNTFVFQPPSLPGDQGGLPVQFVIGTTRPFQELYDVSQQVMAKAQATGKFYVIDNDLKFDKPQVTVNVDRDKAAALGLSNRDVGAALGSFLGGGYVNYFSMQGRSYRVIPQVQKLDRISAEQLNHYYIHTGSGGVIPAGTVISLKTETVPQSIKHFQQLNAATISGVFGGTQGEALDTLRKIAADTLPQGYSIDYSSTSRQYMQESGGFLTTFLFALIIIYLTLAALFESFVDPLVVIMSVPMAIFGAMIFLFLGVATLNIYTEVGLVTLVGLISKHGILIVQFANEQQRAGLGKLEAIENAAGVRLRPILMTSAAMVLGVTPLLFAHGAGAVSRNNIGLVIAAGISIGTLFTLFVVPAMYVFIARDHSRKPETTEAMQLPECIP